MTAEQVERLLTIDEVAEISRMSARRLREAVRAGKLPYIPGKAWLFRPSDVNAFLAGEVTWGVDNAPVPTPRSRRRRPTTR